MSLHYSRLQSKILVSECYLFILLEWSDDVTGSCAHGAARMLAIVLFGQLTNRKA